MSAPDWRRPRPAAWCYRCGGTCELVFLGGEHLPAMPAAPEVAAWDWSVEHLTDAELSNPVWLKALARHLMAWSFQAEHYGAGKSSR